MKNVLLIITILVAITLNADGQISVGGTTVPSQANTNSLKMGTNNTPMKPAPPPVYRVRAPKPTPQVSPAVAALKEQLEQEKVRTLLLAEKAKQARYSADAERRTYGYRNSSYGYGSYRSGYNYRPYYGHEYMIPTYRSSSYFNARAGVHVSTGRHCNVRHTHTSRCR